MSHTFYIGDRVQYDNSEPGTILSRHAAESPTRNTLDYRVEWDNGEITSVWGSDLTPIANVVRDLLDRHGENV